MTRYSDCASINREVEERRALERICEMRNHRKKKTVRARKKKMALKYRLRRGVFFFLLMFAAGFLGYGVFRTVGAQIAEQPAQAAAGTGSQIPQKAAVSIQGPISGTSVQEDSESQKKEREDDPDIQQEEDADGEEDSLADAEAFPEEGEEEGKSTQAEPKPVSMADKESWSLILVNKKNRLPNDFTVESALVDDEHFLDSRIVDDARLMLADAKKDGILLTISAGYPLKAPRENTNAGEAGRACLEEHLTGLSLDLSTRFKQGEKDFEQTPAHSWLMRNAHKYGFILRYPKDKEPVTGVEYTPNHYRYVGKEHAGNMVDAKLCLEEYLR